MNKQVVAWLFHNRRGHAMLGDVLEEKENGYWVRVTSAEGRYEQKEIGKTFWVPREMVQKEILSKRGETMNRKALVRELAIVAKVLLAGDEWVDAGTIEFSKELAKVMKSDRDIDDADAEAGTVRFSYSPNILVSIPLVLRLTEFGFGGVSESVNGMIYSEEVRAFRVPGGFTNKRDARELWRKAKVNLLDIMRRAM